MGMFCCNRKLNEAVIIESPQGDVTVVRVIGIRGCRVELGISGPDDTEFLREELWNSIMAEEAAATPADAGGAAC